MGADFWMVAEWWGTLFLVGAIAFPLTKRLFPHWWDQGYAFSKAVGMVLTPLIVFVLGTLHLLAFTKLSIMLALGIVFVLGIGLHVRRETPHFSAKHLLWEELFFFLALLLWSWVKGHEPAIRGLEKFMDYGFMKSILESRFFPPADMWYAGFPVNYYYFGHMVVAVFTKFSGLDLAYTFNLMLASLFAITATMSWSIGYELLGRAEVGKKLRFVGALVTAYLVTLAGNMQTIYAFTRGYTGDPPAGGPKPFWELLWPWGEFWKRLPEGVATYWYANATRFIPFTIHEFPSYSFVVSDVHGHVLSLPFVLLAIAFLIEFFGSSHEGHVRHEGQRALFYGLLAGVLLMTNASDGPIYAGLFVFLLLIKYFQKRSTMPDAIQHILLLLVGAAGASLPFLVHFKSFVPGLAVNCPPAALANMKIGPMLFEGVEKCQHSPFWMMWLLWGFFWFCGCWLIFSKILHRQGKKIQLRIKLDHHEFLLAVLFVFSLLLIIFPEFFYFKDIYPQHFRSNTMFKLGYQAYILLSIVSGYAITSILFSRRDHPQGKFLISNFQFLNKFSISKFLFILLLLPQLFLVVIYPYFSVRSYFGGLRQYEGLYGLTWFSREYADDYQAMLWLDRETRNKGQEISKTCWLGMSGTCPLSPAVLAPVTLVEADGDSYTDYARMSAFTGIPTIIGWPVHEWLWRGSYDVVAPRREEVRIIYESDDIAATRTILSKYAVRYIVVGELERKKYPNLLEDKISAMTGEVYRFGKTSIYVVGNKP